MMFSLANEGLFSLNKDPTFLTSLAPLSSRNSGFSLQNLSSIPFTSFALCGDCLWEICIRLQQQLCLNMSSCFPSQAVDEKARRKNYILPEHLCIFILSACLLFSSGFSLSTLRHPCPQAGKEQEGCCVHRIVSFPEKGDCPHRCSSQRIRMGFTSLFRSLFLSILALVMFTLIFKCKIE